MPLLTAPLLWLGRGGTPATAVSTGAPLTESLTRFMGPEQCAAMRGPVPDPPGDAGAE
ncbi:hypothetical protein [Streptomyces tuirus]|uniref:hypothetical protein n=1 Tax=Streptomyces tuirus TaxID=68278 RepID=UPI00343ED841